MKKRSLRLDKEVLMSTGVENGLDAGYTYGTGVICFACDYVISRMIDASIDSLGSDCCGGPGGDEGSETCTQTAAAPSCQTIC